MGLGRLSLQVVVVVVAVVVAMVAPIRPEGSVQVVLMPPWSRSAVAEPNLWERQD